MQCVRIRKDREVSRAAFVASHLSRCEDRPTLGVVTVVVRVQESLDPLGCQPFVEWYRAMEGGPPLSASPSAAMLSICAMKCGRALANRI